ncbi:hypothetical protein MHUMG1_07381 [Metarhizium humberi]|uniref:Uncharacterized protein n=1 Tax=Metarhizium humberi TaxID=2596975 RepID=A0A9P8S4Z7_9HYPO|nr:hypothetical protein MHUMG1_07381 [Metarhizium humberi]
MQTTDARAAQQTGPRVNLDRPIQLVNSPARQLARPRKPPKWKHKWKTALGPGCGSPKSASDWGWGRLRTPRTTDEPPADCQRAAPGTSPGIQGLTPRPLRYAARQAGGRAGFLKLALNSLLFGYSGIYPVLRLE